MAELELTPLAPPPPPNLAHRLLSLHSLGFYVMIVLALAGAAYTFYDANGSRWYWQKLIPPVFSLICVAIQWPEVAPTAPARLLLVGRQILHWGGVLLAVHLAFMASGSTLNATLDARQVGFLLMVVTALGTFLAGVYLDWRLCVVAAALAAAAFGLVILQNVAPLLLLIGLVAIAAYLAWIWGHSRWQERNAAITAP